MASGYYWDKLRYFNPDSRVDQWGSPWVIDGKLLQSLDDFRHFIGCPVIVSSGVRPNKEGSKSFHQPQNGACAVDIVVPGYEKSAFDLILDATRFGFRGIGFYPDWRYKGEIVGGLHLDKRPTKMGARWMGIIDSEGKRRYIDLTITNLMKYAIDDTGTFN